MQPTLLVMAAGMGSRYGGLKQIDAVGPNGEAIIDYSIYDALRAGFERLVFVIRRDIEAAFREAIGGKFEKRIAVDYVFQELDNLPPGFSVPPGRTKPWGTTQAILMAKEAIHEPFAAINADDFYGHESFQVMADFLRASGADYAMIGYTLRNTLSQHGSVSRAVCECDPAGFLRAVVELPKVEKRDRGCASGRPRAQRRRIGVDEFLGFYARVVPAIAGTVQCLSATQRAGIEKRILHSHNGERTGGVGRGPRKSPAHPRFVVRHHVQGRQTAGCRQHSPARGSRRISVEDFGREVAAQIDRAT